MDAPNNSDANMDQKLTEPKGETEKSKIIVGDLNIPVSKVDRKTGREAARTEGPQQHHPPTGLNQHLQYTPSDNSRIHTLFKCLQHTFKEK